MQFRIDLIAPVKALVLLFLPTVVVWVMNFPIMNIIPFGGTNEYDIALLMGLWMASGTVRRIFNVKDA